MGNTGTNISEMPNNDAAIEAIKQFLKELNIKNIIYVDDRFDLDNEKDYFIGSLKSLFKEKTEIDFIESLDWNLPEPKFVKEISNRWDSSDEPTKMRYLVELKTNSGDIDELDNSKPAFEIQTLLPGIILTYTPKQWIESKNEVLNNLEESDQLLCLFDIDFNNKATSNTSYDGVDFASEILSGDYSERIYCGLFSHTFTIEEESEKRKEFYKERKLDKKRFYTISKERFSRDSSISGFAEGIKNSLLISEIETLKEKSIDLIDDSFNNIRNKLENITPETFNYIVQKSSLENGVWELDTFYRMNNILLESEYKSLIADKRRRKSIQSEVNKIRRFEKIEFGEKQNANLPEIKDIRTKELYLEDKIINKLHYPISNGDIFKIGTKEYILLVQPCNISIRPSGRREPDSIIGMLVEILNVNAGTFEKEINFFKVREFLDNKQEKYVDFPSYKTINLDYLDLCVFNDKGESMISMKKQLDIADYLQTPLFLRYKKLLDIFKKLEKRYIAFYEERGNIQNSNRNIFEQSLIPNISLSNLPGLNSNPYNPQSRLFKFKISRLQRYKSPYSDDLLQKFMLYLSRNGFEHDFSSKIGEH